MTQRLTILDKNAIAELYAIPTFNSTERSHFFSLPESLLDSLSVEKTNNRNCSAKLYFILQHGYFKARHQFFNVPYRDVSEDVSFIMEQYFPNITTPKKLPTHKVQRLTKIKILGSMSFSDDIKCIDKIIAEKTSHLAKITEQIPDIFEEITQALEDASFVLPQYSRLQDGIGAALKKEDKRLSQAVKSALVNQKKTRTSLDALLKKGDVFYAITALKFDAKSFQTKEMTAELHKLTLCHSIYHFSIAFLPTLGLSRGMIDYYADLLHIYTADKLDLLPKETAYLYMICYIHHRYERVMNNVTQGFAYYVDKYQNDSEKYAKNTLHVEMPLEKRQTEIGTLMQIFTNKEIMKLPGEKIEAAAFKVMPEEDIMSVSDQLIHGAKHKKLEEKKQEWNYHKNNIQSIIINLRPLFLAIDFTGNKKLKSLFKSIKFLKKVLQNEKSLKTFPPDRIPTAHIKPDFLIKHFMEPNGETGKRKAKKIMNLYQYEFYIYHMIRENLQKNTVYVNHSIGYKSFEAEVNIPKNWHEQEKQVLAILNNSVLLRSMDDTLLELANILEPAIERTNRRALNGENKHINITYARDGSTTWTLPYPKGNPESDNPFYNQLEIKQISEIYDFVAQDTGFSELFTHIKPRGAKGKLDYLANKGVVCANGTTHGTHAFSKLSNLAYKQLQTAEQNNIRLSTLRAAINKIIQCMIQLPIFDLYDLSNNKHGNADGTKKKTRRRILKARHSTKYFGTDVGVVVMTMSMNHVPFASRVISPNEHEGNFIYPMLSQNTSLIDPDIISTDTAGANNVNDFMYYLIGKTHAPCYRSTPRKAKTICGFKPLSHYKDCLIKPASTVNRKLIKKHWPKLVPILASILSHEVSQENVIKKLSSHDYQSDVKEALWELNKILKSIHLLKYIDDIQYRRDIRVSLNRGESYHQLLSKIMAVGGGDFRGMTELEIEIWNECTHLIALIIIYYNMNLLSKLYEAALANNDTAAIEYLKHISPVASQHVQLGGLYAFSEMPATIDVEQIVRLLSKILEDSVGKNHQ